MTGKGGNWGRLSEGVEPDTLIECELRRCTSENTTNWSALS